MALQSRGYEVIKEIGRGSFGGALLVRHARCPVALVAKEMDTRSLPPPDVEAARNEVAVLAQLDHPNITKFIESFEKSGIIYIVMEHADGGDLQSLLRKQKEKGDPLSEGVVTDYLIQMCFALRHLHKRRILHRDLKTANVFLTSDGVIKLGDFGVAKRLGEVGLAATMCGTPYYFAPEMCRGEPYSQKCDVWALGIILYELIRLRKPFYGATTDALVAAVADGSYQPLTAANSPGFCDELRGLCHSMLKLKTSERPHITEVMATEYMQRELARFAASIRSRTASCDTLPAAAAEAQRKYKMREEECSSPTAASAGQASAAGRQNGKCVVS
eukprot:TRINITY_DN6041_c0_g1_i2.p1 TRINITY_DN6041_c0_g1~~TRINITY_DN6041_c0_g1_i2.p1  ORF type:complete len:331 (+),score=24.95 TRINITY_DN6041_c0_g1_i2:93-1085(+)